LQVVSVVPASKVLETGRRPLGVRLRLRLGTGQATDRASNAIDIAIAITDFITESSMMYSWNSAAVEQGAKPLFGLQAENQLVFTARPECLWRVDLHDPNPPSAAVDQEAEADSAQ
jgi:hypothetical protein